MNERTSRIESDRQRLVRLVGQHPWLETVGGAAGSEPALVVRIQGRALTGAGPEPDRFVVAEQHRIRIDFPDDYPDSGPGFHLETPVFHPNLPADGRVSVAETGLTWAADLPPDIVLERLWDLMRGARFDVLNAVNVAAARWYASQTALTFPLDPRRFSSRAELKNIVRYRPHSGDDRIRPQADAGPLIIDGRNEEPDSPPPVHFID